jgi:flagellar hook-basal body complex protein FliE
MNINSLGLEGLTNKIIPKTQDNQVQSKSFEDYLTGALDEVNATQVKAYDAMEGIATGKVENIQDAVAKINEAELSLKLALEVKNKAIMSYKEIMKMQI